MYVKTIFYERFFFTVIIAGQEKEFTNELVYNNTILLHLEK